MNSRRDYRWCEKRQRTAALQDASRGPGAVDVPPGFGVLRSSAAVGLALCVMWLAGGSLAAERSEAPPADLRWPATTRENRPWTRWWWLGSAVDETNLTRLLIEY